MPPGPDTRARSRTLRRVVIAGVVLVVVAWTAFAATSLLRARRDAQTGLDRLRTTQDRLHAADLIRGEGLGDLRAAQADFERAHRAASSPTLAPFAVLPVVGRQVRSVESLSGAAADVVRIGADAMAASSAEIDRQSGQGAERVALLTRLGEIAGGARRQLGDVDLGPSSALVSPLARARDKFEVQLGDIRTAVEDVDAASRGLTAMLQGPSRYLLLAANNAEMRAGSGTWLSAGPLDFADGAFDLGDMTPTGELTLPEGAVPVTGDLAARWGWARPSQEWRSLALSPQLPANAALAAQMWKARTGQDVQGVLVLDAVALRALLAATGPVVVDGQTITKDNVVREVLLDQYLDLPFDVTNPNNDRPQIRERRERMARIAQAVVDHADQTGWDTATLVDELRVAASGRHVLAWSSVPEQQRAWKAAGVDGALPDDGMLLAVSNQAGNKLDQFLDVRARLTSRTRGDGSRAVTVRITLTNKAPTGLGPYVAGPYPFSSFREGQYSGILALDVPGGARGLAMEGVGQVVAQGDDYSTQVVAGTVSLDRGQSVTATVRFRLPAGVDVISVQPSARIPVDTWQAGGATFTDDVAHDVRL